LNEDGKFISLIRHNFLTKDTQLYIPLTDQKYTSHFDLFVTDSGEKDKKHIFHQYSIKQDSKSITTATVRFSVFENITSRAFDYNNKHYVIKS
jgi:hypothetical protein